jgi:hypothetical protein
MIMVGACASEIAPGERRRGGQEGTVERSVVLPDPFLSRRGGCRHVPGKSRSLHRGTIMCGAGGFMRTRRLGPGAFVRMKRLP